MAYYTRGQGYVTEEIPGRTIYAAYYKFMVKKGFFDKSLIDKKSIWQLG